MSDDTIRFAAAASGHISIYDFYGLSGPSDELRSYSMAESEAHINDFRTGLHLVAAPAVIRLSNGGEHIVGQLSADRQLWHFGPNIKEQLPAGNFEGTPTMCSWGGERLDVFILSADNHQIYHCYQDKKGGKWEGWFGDVGQVPNGFKSAPTAVSWGKGRIDIVARGADDGVWHKCYDSAFKGWQPWRSLGGTVTAAPTICTVKPQRLDVFVRGQDNRLWHKYWDSGTHWYYPRDSTIDDWADEAGAPPPPDYLISAPVAVVRNRYMYVLAVGHGMAVWNTWWDGSGWANWKPTFVDNRNYPAGF